MTHTAGTSATGASATSLPRVVGRRLLLKLAARGGMGDVYLAASVGIEGAERPCIVKAVRRDHAHDASFVARFLDEARVQAQLSHPGVAQVLEAAMDEAGQPYTVVEYVEGHSLGEVRQRSLQMQGAGAPIGWAEGVAVAIEIAQALAHVHERAGADGAPLGIVHRDLSPQNVMVGYAGEVKLIDFGTARGHNRRCHTVAGVVFAKPGYVAPEVAREQVGDGRIDLYALGVVLWELCAGRRLLASDPQKYLDDIAAGRMVVPEIARACGAPADLDDVIARLTRNDPDDRYATASLVVRDLARVLTSAPPLDGGARSVRARLSALMTRLWPHEPARSRAEFARLLREARERLPAGPSPVEATAEAPCTPPASPAPADPSRLGGTPYRLLRRIGRGATSVVWEAEHVELGRRLAVKVLAPEHAASPASMERFRREARALAALAHPNLVQTLDFGTAADGRVFSTMELLVGETLEARLRGGPLSEREAVRVAIEACRALEAAHGAGLVHCDLKPANLVVTTAGAVKLLDFGLAVVPAERRGPSGPPEDVAKQRSLQGFAVFGTPAYMSPEQVAGLPVDGRADVYALGCVLYEMLTGSPPFPGASDVVVMGRHLREAPRPPSTVPASRACGARVERALLRALEKDPAHRFESAGALRCALERALDGIDARRAVSALRERASAWSRRRRPAAAVAAAAAVAVVTCAIGAARRNHSNLASVVDVTAPAGSAAPSPTAVQAVPPATAAAATAGPPADDVRGAEPRRDAHAPSKSHPTDTDETTPRTSSRAPGSRVKR